MLEINLIGINSKKETFLASIIQQKIQRRHEKKLNKRINKYCSQRHNNQPKSVITLTKVVEEGDVDQSKHIACDSCSTTCDLASEIPCEICYYKKDDDDDTDSLISFLTDNPNQAKSIFSGVIGDTDDMVVVLPHVDNDCRFKHDDHLWTGKIMLDESSTVTIEKFEQTENIKSDENYNVMISANKDNVSSSNTSETISSRQEVFVDQTENKKSDRNDNVMMSTIKDNVISSITAENIMISTNKDNVSSSNTAENISSRQEVFMGKTYPKIIPTLITSACAVTIIIVLIQKLYISQPAIPHDSLFNSTTSSSTTPKFCNHYYFLVPKIIINKNNILDNSYLE